MKYLFDANIFIEAKNRYYAFDICPGFWDWMDHIVNHGVGSISIVKDELCKGGDELADWMQARAEQAWVLDVSDVETQKRFATVAAHIQSAGYDASAMQKFLSGADPWLIAKARALGATLVTHEALAPGAKRRVPIPNVCLALGVQCANPFDVLRTLAANFTFSAP